MAQWHVGHRSEQQANRMTALLGEQESQRVARLCHRDMQPVVVQADGHRHVLTGHVF